MALNTRGIVRKPSSTKRIDNLDSQIMRIEEIKEKLEK